MKTISILLALVNSLLAGLLIAYNLSGSEMRQAELWWFLTKICAGLGVIAISMMAFLGSMRAVSPSLLSLGSLFLAALGAATIVWTLHLSTVTDDMEYHMIVYGGSLMVQGMASLLGLVEGTRNVMA